MTLLHPVDAVNKPQLPLPLVLASQSPRRRDLLAEAGYEFEVQPASDGAECGLCSRETPPELVARLAYQKAIDVARQRRDVLVLGCDTVAECCGQILGKPHHRDHAREMLQLMRGRAHQVFSGVCLLAAPEGEPLVRVDVTRLKMDDLSDQAIEEYLDTNGWEGKAGAFGYQDRLGWVQIVEGSESNVVGLPMELLARMLGEIKLSPGDQIESSEA